MHFQHKFHVVIMYYLFIFCWAQFSTNLLIMSVFTALVVSDFDIRVMLVHLINLVGEYFVFKSSGRVSVALILFLPKFLVVFANEFHLDLEFSLVYN